MDLSHKKSFLLLTISSIIIFAVVYCITARIFEPNASNDFMIKKASANKVASKDIILIVIDDKSLVELGRWPWKRTRYLQIFDYLKKYTKAKAYAFDSLIVAPDTEDSISDAEFFTKVKKYDKLVAGVSFSSIPFPDEATATLYNRLLREKNDIKIIDKRSPKNKTESHFYSFTQSPVEYMKHVAAIGSLNIDDDKEDTYVRKTHQLVAYDGQLFPSMPLVAYSKVSGIKEFTLTDNFLTGEGNGYSLKMPAYNQDGVIYSYICFYDTKDGTYSHKKVSASDVIKSFNALERGEKPILNSEIFDDKIVFVGAFANAQALEDVQRTPVSNKFSGLDIQATIFDNFYQNQFYTRASEVFNFLLTSALFLLVLLAIRSMPISVAILCTASAMCLFLIFTYMMYMNNIATRFMLPMVSMCIAVAAGYGYRYFTEGRKKDKIQSAMGKYISKDVMKNVIDNIDIKDVGLGGKRANVTVLFIDIRGFTTISERLSAQEVATILNEYFSAIAPVIDKHNGILNKFMGDAILAIFGEPIQDENHPVNAVKCADEMLRSVRNLQEKWITEGKPRIDVGIGIATGDAFVGNIGSEERLEYTVIGDTVNTASRIENYNKVYKTKFLISEETFERVQKHVDVLKIRDVSVRGKTKKINIYEVLRLIK